LTIGERDRIAVLGPNGSGKTTLFEMIAGNITPDDGVITRRRGITTGYLKQDVEPFSDRLLLEEVINSCEKTKAVKERIDAIIMQLESALDDGRKPACLMNWGSFNTGSRFSAETISNITPK
jgi:ATP-binding cassette subfamily F protein 3